ncbi:MAG TPA: hypothetical protein VFE32_04475 [Puia sp.]|jgi:hypothetical protein|nr:hypothetical protein [Puia sp.]
MNTAFIHFVIRKKMPRRLLTTAGVLIIVQFALFKLLYPFPDFSSDAYDYIYGAISNLEINITPIGYSKFLRFFHIITHSDTALIAFQYFFLEMAALYFYFTIFYFYHPGKITRNILFFSLFLDPLFLYIGNYISNDSLFIALSLAWFAELFWVINRPTFAQVLVQLILLFLCLIVSYHAYFYPAIAIVAFVLSRQAIPVKFAGVILSVLTTLAFVAHTRHVAKEMTGKPQFSLSKGWQLANNVLHMYVHLRGSNITLPSQESQELNRFALQFYDKSGNLDYSPAAFDANFFIRESNTPLTQYFTRHFRPANDYERVSDWGKASVLFGTFGKSLIRNFPTAYAQYFLWPNVKNYFLPELQELAVYNIGEDDVSSLAQDWFDYQIPNVNAASNTIQGQVLFIFPYIFLFSNAFFALCIIWWFMKRKEVKPNRELFQAIILTACFVTANFWAEVCSEIIVMRHQIIPMIISIFSPLLIIDWLEKNDSPTEHKICLYEKKLLSNNND